MGMCIGEPPGRGGRVYSGAQICGTGAFDQGGWDVLCLSDTSRGSGSVAVR